MGIEYAHGESKLIDNNPDGLLEIRVVRHENCRLVSSAVTIVHQVHAQIHV